MTSKFKKNNYVECMVCNTKLKRVTNTHLKKHKMTTDNYIKKYPKAELMTQELRDKYSKTSKGKTYDEIYGKYRSNSLKKLKSKKLTQYGLVETNCEYCKKVFTYKENDHRRYCSVTCKFQSHKLMIKTKKCKNCGNKFKVRPYEQKVFCSNRCAGDFKKRVNEIKSTCSYCSKELKRKINGNTNTFCSKEHRELFSKTLSNDYRIKCIANYGKICLRCKTTENIVVHHKDGNRLNNEIENLEPLCRKCHSKVHMELNKVNNKFIGQAKIEQGATLILEGLKSRFGLDLSDPNFSETPMRVARAYEEMCSGINSSVQVKEILSTAFPSKYKGMVCATNIKCFSLCPHHLLPIEYTVQLGIIYDEKMLGISKISRLVELLGQQPLMQESFTQLIVDTFEKELNTRGMIVLVDGEHMCMRARGVKKTEGCITTSAVTGYFKDNINTKNEFMELVKNAKNKIK